jgi:CRISPR-associated protein Cas6
MSAEPGFSELMLDAVFPVDGQFLAREHALALHAALVTRWPWLDEDVMSGIHAIKLVTGSSALAMLSRRSRLLLRVRAERMPELLSLPSDLELDVAGQVLRLGKPHARRLQPHSTLYAYKLAANSADEVSFMQTVQQELADLGIGGERVCGKHACTLLDGVESHTFSMMLHALTPAHSLRLQEFGLGPKRLLGCGLFVPHKSAAAV